MILPTDVSEAFIQEGFRKVQSAWRPTLVPLRRPRSPEFIRARTIELEAENPAKFAQKPKRHRSCLSLRVLCSAAIAVVLYSERVSASQASLTDDQLEYGTRTKDRRFLRDFSDETQRDFNAPFQLLAGWQEAFQRETGIRLYFDYYGVFLGNPVGGLSQGVGYSHEIVFGGHVDLDRIFGWQGATFTASFGDGAGYNLSRRVGNFFTVSESYIENTGALYNLYLTQKAFDEKLDLQIGRMTAGQFFATLPAFGLQVSGGINGNPANLFSNAPFHAGITATWAATIKYKPTPTTYLSSGIFQASPRLGVYAYHGTDFSIRPGDGILMMFEAGWKPTLGLSGPPQRSPIQQEKETSSAGIPGLPGIYKIGGYYSNYTFQMFGGGVEHNAFGFYAMAQQMVWRAAGKKIQNLSIWGGIVYSPQTDIALMPFMGYSGTIWQGILPARDQDMWLFTWLIGNFSSAFANSASNSGLTAPTYETVFETSYIIQLNQYLSIQPDIQYIVRPSGYSDIPNALVIGVQATVSF
jgi:porin